MRFLSVVGVVVALASVGADAQQRLAMQDVPEPERRPQHKARAEVLERVGTTLMAAGFGFWALETFHKRESCDAGGCVAEKRGVYTWSTVAAWSGAAVAFGWKLSLGRGSVDVGIGHVRYSLGW